MIKYDSTNDHCYFEWISIYYLKSTYLILNSTCLIFNIENSEFTK